jgi:hypothetical protein
MMVASLAPNDEYSGYAWDILHILKDGNNVKKLKKYFDKVGAGNFRTEKGLAYFEKGARKAIKKILELIDK